MSARAFRDLEDARDDYRSAVRYGRSLIGVAGGSLLAGTSGIPLASVLANPAYVCITVVFWICAIISAICAFAYYDYEVRPARKELRRAQGAYEEALLRSP